MTSCLRARPVRLDSGSSVRTRIERVKRPDRDFDVKRQQSARSRAHKRFRPFRIYVPTYYNIIVQPILRIRVEYTFHYLRRVLRSSTLLFAEFRAYHHHRRRRRGKPLPGRIKRAAVAVSSFSRRRTNNAVAVRSPQSPGARKISFVNRRSSQTVRRNGYFAALVNRTLFFYCYYYNLSRPSRRSGFAARRKRGFRARRTRSETKPIGVRPVLGEPFRLVAI